MFMTFFLALLRLIRSPQIDPPIGRSIMHAQYSLCKDKLSGGSEGWAHPMCQRSGTNATRNGGKVDE